MMPTPVAKTNIERVAIISTVQLPPNASFGNPFETMIFFEDESKEEYQVRSVTRAGALLAHIDAIAFVIGYEE